MFLAALSIAFACSAEIKLKEGDRIAIIGDSITEQKLYSVYMEFYLRVCSGLGNISVIQFGHGGEHASGYAAHRMKDTCSWYSPSVATVCYGMNDGQYRKFNDRTAGNYRNGLRKIASYMNENKVRLLISSPGAVDTDTFRRFSAEEYNKTLAELGRIGKETAAEQHAEYADLHSLLLTVMRKAKAKYGASYHVCGPDGIHPARNGHLVMAYVMLKGLGMDGNIAEIKIDCASGKAQASEGHKIISSSPGSVTLESTRWPFCFWQVPAKPLPTSDTTILPFLPFNKDLNRFVLTVVNLPSSGAEIQFGSGNFIYFSKTDLENGINLNDFFLGRDNAFHHITNTLYQEIRAKQMFETRIFRHYQTGLRTAMPDFEKRSAEVANACDIISRELKNDWEKMENSIKKLAATPHKYTITVRPYERNKSK